MPVETKAVTIDLANVAGQITVATAGTRVQGTAIRLQNGVYIRALSGNAGKIYVGGSDVSSSAGFELAAGDTILVSVSNLSELWFDASASGDKVSWIKG